MEKHSDPSDLHHDDVLSDIEIRREQQKAQGAHDELKRLMSGMHKRYLLAMACLVKTGSFTEQDLQGMMRGQVLHPEFGGDYPCRAYHDKNDLDDLEVVERRSYYQSRYGAPLDPVPVARRRLHCPLYERGRKGDPLVPCYHAQRANPRYPKGGDGALLLPADLPEEQREMIKMFSTRQTDLFPCHVVQAMCQYYLGGQIEDEEPALFQIRPRPVAPAPRPPEERSGDLGLRRLLQSRQALLEEAARLESAEELHRRELLRHLVQTGRLKASDFVTMSYDLIMVTDEGWLPCRDDVQRSYIEPVDVDGSLEERRHQPGVLVEDVLPQRNVCFLKVRALEGDPTVPCCEAQKVAPSPERVAQVKARGERYQRESEEFWRKRGGLPEKFQEKEQPPNWAGEQDAPGGPQDIVRLLNIRPCYLLGHAAATYLFQHGQWLARHPELLGLDDEVEGDGAEGEDTYDDELEDEDKDE